MSQPSPDRRRHPRYEVEVRVHLAQLGEVTGALTRDISAGGLFIATTTPLPLESCVPLRLVDPRSGEQIATICEVVRELRDANEQLEGLGLRFIHQDEALTRRLEQLISPALPEVASPADLPSEPSWAELQAEVPLDSIPIPTTRQVPGDLAPRLLLLLASIDGERTAEEVALQAAQPLTEALTNLGQLAQRGLVGISRALDEAILEVVLPVLDTAQEQTRAAHVDERVRLFIDEAGHATAERRFAEAVNLFEQALVLDQADAAEIHTRIAELALGPLASGRLARTHAEALCQRFPHDPRGPALLARTTAFEQERQARR